MSMQPDVPIMSPLSSPVIPFGRTGSNSNFIVRTTTSNIFEAMQEDDDDIIEFVSSAARKTPPNSSPGASLTPMSGGSDGGLPRAPSSGIAPYRVGSSSEMDILEELRGVLDINLPGAGGDSRKDDLRHEPEEKVEERRGRSMRPKTIFWQKKKLCPWQLDTARH